MNEIRKLQMGMTVADIGGSPMGFVKNVGGDWFVLELADGRTVTLHEDVLFSVSDHSAALICSASGAARYRMPAH